MKFGLFVTCISAGLFIALLGTIRLGWWYGGKSASLFNFLDAFRVTEAAVYGMLGLLFAFTFYGAAVRFDARRNLVVEETNAIGTAYLRLDLLSDAARQKAQNTLKTYLDARL